MSTRSLNKILTGLKVKKRSWIPKIKRRKGNNDDSRKNELALSTFLSTEPGEISSIENEENQEQLYSIIPISIFNLPTEIYLQIFSYLLFADLYMLSCVSKFFRDLLWSKSEFTQSIWKNCRSLYYPKYPKLPPPDGMCEQQYIWITLAKKTCQFCKETYENSNYVKWITKINCCDLCMAEDKYTMEENSVNKSIIFPRELKGCIPYTEYIGYFDPNGLALDGVKFNYHRYYFIQDVEKIKNEYDSLVEEEKKDWIENKRKELKTHLEKIKDYQKQDSVYYWSKIKVPEPEIIEIDDDDDDENDDENDDEEDDVQVYDRVIYNQEDYDLDDPLDYDYYDLDYDDDDEILL